MTPQKHRSFDATWMPFGMLIGFIVGMGIALTMTDSLVTAAACGFASGIALGIILGFRPRHRSTTDEDAEDDRYRAEHGDPTPRRDDDH